MSPRFLLLMFAIAICSSVTRAADPKEKEPNVDLAWGNLMLRNVIRDQDLKKIRSLENWETKGAVVGTYNEAPLPTLASLAKIPQLRKLTLRQLDDVKDLKFLKTLPHLEYLYIFFMADDAVFDCNEIAHLKDLKELVVDDVRLKNVAALKACTKLKELGLKGAAIDSLDFASGTPQLERLSLNGSKHTFASYAPLTKLTRLKDLSVYINKQMTDESAAFIGSFKRLEKLNIGFCTKLTTLDFLKPCVRLKVVDANGAYKLADISALAKMPDLEEVCLTASKIENLTAFRGKKKLKDLKFSACKKVKDLSPLASCPALEELWFERTAVTDIAPLAKCRKLRFLRFPSTTVTSLKPLRHCKNLERLDVPKTVPERHIQAIKKTFPKCNLILPR